MAECQRLKSGLGAQGWVSWFITLMGFICFILLILLVDLVLFGINLLSLDGRENAKNCRFYEDVALSWVSFLCEEGG